MEGLARVAANAGYLFSEVSESFKRRAELEQERAHADLMASRGFDMREEHDQIDEQLRMLPKPPRPRGAAIVYMEIDGVPL